LRYIANLEVKDDGNDFNNLFNMVTEFGLKSKFLEESSKFDACYQLFYKKYLESNHFKNKIKLGSRTKVLTDYFAIPPESPFLLEKINLGNIKFSIRTYNCLVKNMKLKTLSDIMKISESDIMANKGIGQKSIDEINQLLKIMDFDLLKK